MEFNLKNKKLYILPTLTLILAVIFFFSFIPKQNEKSMQTAILNPKYVEKIDSIILSKNDKELELFKQNNLWKGKSKEIIFPVEQKQIENFIKKLKKIRKVYKISDNITNFQTFSLDENSAFILSYSGKDVPKTTLLIGSQDFSKTMIHIRSKDSPSILKTEDDFSVYLHNETRFWLDPYIIPKNLNSSTNLDIQKVSLILNGKRKTLIPNTEKSQINIEKFLELRHGSLLNEIQQKNLLCTVEIEETSLGLFSIDFYEYNSQDVALVYRLDLSWNYQVLISNWTYSKILELFGLI